MLKRIFVKKSTWLMFLGLLLYASSIDCSLALELSQQLSLNALPVEKEQLLNSQFYECSDVQEEKKYCFDEQRYYQLVFYAEVLLTQNRREYVLFSPYDLVTWTQIQLGFAKDRLQLAKVTTAEQTFDVKARWRNVGDETGLSALDKSLILFLNQIKGKPQQQIWLPEAQYLSVHPELSVELRHDTQSIELRITRRLTLSPSE